MRRAAVRAVVIMGLSAGMGRSVSNVEAGDPEVSVTLAPVRQAFVDGDREKFRAHHWMNDNYAGGIKDFSAHHAFQDGTALSAEGHALIDANDLGAELSLKKADLGFIDLDFSEFRKYFEGTGGVHRRFSTLQVNETDHELALDIGRLTLETGMTLEGWPELGFEYEREFKDGAKSRLTWASVTEFGEVRKIAPSWQEVDEIVDSFALKASHELAGVAWKGEQRWELARSESLREEPYLATTGVAADVRIRRQDQAPETTLMTTTLSGERNFLEDKVFMSSGYHFAHLRSREFETLMELNAQGVATDFATTSEQKPNNHANSHYDSHTWVGSILTTPLEWLSVGTKLKSEVIKRRSNSAYNIDVNTASGGSQTGEPDGIINEIDNNITDTKAVRWGEGMSLRVTAIPRTALYTELEFEQGRVLLREDRQGIDGPDSGTIVSGETFSRETVTSVRRGAWTLGGRIDPWRLLDVTAQVRHRVNNNDYDDQRETAPGSSTARSAFIDSQGVHTNEFATRVTFRPCRWFRSSFRYQFRDDKFRTAVETQPIVKTNWASHIYTFDVGLQPIRQLSTTASFSRQTAVTSTPARLSGSANIPAFHADVDTWLLSTDYSPTPAVTLSSTLQLSWAENFDDYANRGMPYGADFHRADFTTGVKWAMREATSVGVDYALYRYNPNENVEVGEYTAHVIWLEISQQF